MSWWKKSVTPAEWLGELAFFEGFNEEELRRVAELSEEIEAAEGAVLMDQGDAATECFVIVHGTASVTAAGHHVATLGSGAIVGEMALVDHKPRIATVIALTPMKLLRFDSAHFRTLLDEMPRASERVMTLLMSRLPESD